MNQLVKLSLNSKRNSCVKAQMSVTTSQGEVMSITRELPSAQTVIAQYQNWRTTYASLQMTDEIQSRGIIVESVGEYSTLSGDYSSTPQNCEQKATLFRQSLNEWLRDSNFVDIRQQLTYLFSQPVSTHFIICTDEPELQHLPWVLWDLLQHYPAIEVAISGQTFQKRPEHFRFPSQTDQVRILAILGDSKGINIEADKHFLEELPNADIAFLPTPLRTHLHDRLWEEPRDILFFAGHSSSQGGTGKLRINEHDELLLDDFEHALERMARNGLTLAIFNSCDGLGLAKRLTTIEPQIPYIIVMRESVPDKIAQDFLKIFLSSFSQGTEFHKAVRESRERLERLNVGELSSYGDWMPVIWQNPLAEPPQWPKPKPGRILQQLKGLLGVSGTLTLLTVGLRVLGAFQGLEIYGLDQLMSSRPYETVDPRILVVTVTEADVQAQADTSGQGSLSDNALSKLLQQLTAMEAHSIGLDIYRDFPVGDDYPQLTQQLTTLNNLIATCKGSDASEGIDGISPPPEVSTQNLGFSDLIEDFDNKIRRHLLSFTPEPASPCQATYAINTLLALSYLDKKGIKIAATEEGYLQAGNVVFRPIGSRFGSYQGIDNSGHQILLNYRHLESPEKIAEQVTLRDVLEDRVDATAVRDRIILIGTTDRSYKDYWSIPYKVGQSHYSETAGVFLQAHMISQILSAVLDDRPLIRAWPDWIETYWIFSWAAVGSLLIYCNTNPSKQNINWVKILLGAIVAELTLLSCSWVLLVCYGYWIPLVPAAMIIPLSTSGTAAYIQSIANSTSS